MISRSARAHTLLIFVIALVPLFAVTLGSADSEQPANEHFADTWARTDLPVSEDRVDRTWMWGPAANTGAIVEPYADSPGGERMVQYFDKTRMEINDPHGDPGSPWYVTNGLLARDLMTGRVQVGDNQFQLHEPAGIPVAGDTADKSAPTYATFNALRDHPARPEGTVIVQTIDRFANISSNEKLAGHGVTDARYVPETGHNVASVFWDYMNSSGPIFTNGMFIDGELFRNPFYATGFPLTDAFWSTVQVDEESKEVLIQVFQRRVLTYTPENPDGWRVEAGNVGLHYYHWVYGELGNDHGEPLPLDSGDSSACLDGHESGFLTLLNQYRQENGLEPLANSAALNVASHEHSEDMGTRGYLAHNSPEGETPRDRMSSAGYDYDTYWAENIAAGYSDAAAVFEVWRTSSGHNQNMLSPSVGVIGIARVEVPGSDYGVYWTTKFGGHVDEAPNC